MIALHASVLIAAAYGLCTIVPRGHARRGAAALALVPALLAFLVISSGLALNALAVGISYVIAFAGLLAHDRLQSGRLWLAAQVAVLSAFTLLPIWAIPRVAVVLTGLVAAALLALGLIVTVEWGATWVGLAIRPFSDRMYGARLDDDGVVTRRGLPKGFEDGGRTIGRLERLLIFLFVLVGSPAAIGFLVTAKSILRFGEIKDRETQKEAEYIIIGTLMSFGFALVSAYLTRLALQVLLPEAASVLLIL